MSINVAIVGYGYAGKFFHAQLINIVDGLNLYAICTRDPTKREQAQKDWGVKVYCDFAEMLDDHNIDLVILATPHDTHAALAIKAMNAGKHLITDKVMCLNTAEADAMLEASKKNQVLLSVFHNRRWDGDYLTLKKIMKDDLLGPIFMVESTVMGYRCPRGWRRQKAHGGGLLYDWGAHLIDQALQLIHSKVQTVFCDYQYRVWDTDVENHVKCLLRFANGTLYLIELSNIAKMIKPRWYILGEKGALTKQGFDPQEAALLRGEVGIPLKEETQYNAKIKTTLNGLPVDLQIETLPGDWKAYYINISEVLNEGKELIVKPEQTRKAIAITEAAIQSAQKAESVKVKQ